MGRHYAKDYAKLFVIRGHRKCEWFFGPCQCQRPCGVPRQLGNWQPTFAYIHLIRNLIVDASPLRRNDGMDFCHGVPACAFASFATLDKSWKHRVDSIPKPNGLARTLFSFSARRDGCRYGIVGGESPLGGGKHHPLSPHHPQRSVRLNPGPCTRDSPASPQSSVVSRHAFGSKLPPGGNTTICRI